MTALQMEDGADLKVQIIMWDMVSIHSFSMQELLSEAAQRFTANLASYAIPIFIRICKEVEKTGEQCIAIPQMNMDSSGSYKLKKTDLQKAGFDLSKVDSK